ncbi:MAG: dihydrolipoyl dehydrogenase [Candidatus Omnitrophica bacterium]|nr:dihydrolipoyl dehydrogenase [Candidatus Omnitrophota bacterium]
MNKYDVVIIGGGPAGYPCAIRCSQYGLKTVLIEKSQLGGCCLNTGCIPTKTLFNIAKLLKNPGIDGINVSASFDWERVLKHVKTNVVSRLKAGIAMLLKANGVEYIEGEGEIKEPSFVIVNGKELTAKKFVIATGARPAIQKVFCNDPRIITTDTIWNLEKLPQSLAIVGAGPVGCEFASILACFGVKITIYEMLDTILVGRDREIVAIIEKEFAKRGIQIKTGTKITSTNEIVEEKILWAGGRKPVLDIAEDLEISVSQSGVDVDLMMKTSVPDIYAAGDVTGKWQLAYVATKQGEIAAENCAGKNEVISYENIPETIFTTPEIGTVGITEQEAQSQKKEIKIGRFPYMALGKAHAAGNTSGMAKVIVDQETDKLLGVHIAGEQASEIVHIASIAMSKGMTLKEMTNAYWSHPTFSEILMEALFVAEGKPLHIIKR